LEIVPHAFLSVALGNGCHWFARSVCFRRSAEYVEFNKSRCCPREITVAITERKRSEIEHDPDVRRWVVIR